MSVQQRVVAAADAGIRLDRWFKRHHPDLGHVQLEKLLRTGQVRVDGARAKASDRLEAGQTIRVPPLDHLRRAEAHDAPWRQAPALSDKDRAFVQRLVLYKDADVLVLDKPHGLAVQGGTGTERHLDALLDGLRFDADERPRLVHRLDRDTSGVLVLGRSASAAAMLAKAFRERRTRKIYWALTAGVPKPFTGKVDAALVKQGPSGGERMRLSDEDAEDAKRAVTLYAVQGRAEQLFAWVALMPVTGRTHQLRAHMAALGTPIVGDFKYGGSKARPHGGAIPDKLQLHARRLILPLPGRTLDVSAPPPPHMAKAFALFGFDADDRSDPFRGRG